MPARQLLRLHVSRSSCRAPRQLLRDLPLSCGGCSRPSMTPVEFSVAAFRFGHTQVRRAYRLNEMNGSPELPGVLPGRPAGEPHGRPPDRSRPADRLGMFFEEPGGDPTRRAPQHRPQDRPADLEVACSSCRSRAPRPRARNVLAFRNMIRAKFYDMPSGQSVARALRLPVLTPTQLEPRPGLRGRRAALVLHPGRVLGPAGRAGPTAAASRSSPRRSRA